MSSPIRMWKPRPIKPTSDGPMPCVSLVVASYLNDDHRRLDSLLCLLYSIKAQTYPHWEVLVLHDGPIADRAKFAQLDRLAGAGRIWLIETAERKGQFGHPHRQTGIRHATGHYIGLSNDDNYYAPTYFESMVYALHQQQAELAYCDMVHSHRQWEVIRAAPRRGFIDAGSWIGSAELVKGTPWTDMTFAGDWTFFNELHRKARKAVKVPGVLFVHN